MQLFGVNGTTIADVDPTQKAARTNVRPLEVLSWVTIAAKSGVIATPAAAANLFSFRNSGSNNVLIRRLGVGAVVAGAVTTSQVFDLAAYVARGFTAADSGGTSLTFSGNNGKHRTSLASLSFAATAGTAQISTTGALTAGTRTLDSTPVGQAAGTSGTAVGTTIIVPTKNNLIAHDTSDYPILLANNEGLVIQAVTALATGSVYLYVDMEVAEVATTVF